MAILTQTVANRLFENGWFDCLIGWAMGDEVNVMLVVPDRLDSCPERGRTLQVDVEIPQHRHAAGGKPSASSLIVLLRKLALRRTNLKSSHHFVEDGYNPRFAVEPCMIKQH
jgi:hypothetical protein